MARQREDGPMAAQPPVEAMVRPQAGERGAMAPKPRAAGAADAARISRVC